MFTRTINIPRFFYVEKGLIDNINELLIEEKLEMNRCLIVTGSKSTKPIGDSIMKSLDSASSRIAINDNDLLSIDKLKIAIEDSNVSLVIGVGGGRILDIVKFACYNTQKPFLAIPTTLSNDGISSPIAVIKTNEGARTTGANPPIGIIVDIEIIQNAPKQTTLAGIGELISNISAIQDWKLAHVYAGEKIDKFAEILAKSSAERLMYYINRNGDKQLLKDDKFLILLAEGLIESGIAMSIAGSSRPCSGAEHLISHALDKIFEQHKPHGIQVGVATLFTMTLHKKDIGYLHDIFELVEFPTTLKDLNIPTSVFLEAIKVAPTTRKNRFTILDIVTDKEIKEALELAYEAS